MRLLPAKPLAGRLLTLLSDLVRPNLLAFLGERQPLAWGASLLVGVLAAIASVTFRHVASVGDVAWLYAEGHVVIRGDAAEHRSPYRLTGVLERRAGPWRWRLFHGSEPVPDR